MDTGIKLQTWWRILPREIDTFGHIPNGNRSYYLSRSQPPFFAFMVELLAQNKGDDALKQYLPQLQKEYAYWMEGTEDLQPWTK